MIPRPLLRAALASAIACALAASGGCGDDSSNSGSEAQQHGVGSACTADADCIEPGQKCLPFKGGYCGKADCKASADCPSGSACVTHTDGKNYCFLVCVEKVDCNVGRPAEAQSNCSSNVTFTDGNKGSKACVPPT